MTVWAPSVYRCDEHGATLVFHAGHSPGPSNLKESDLKQSDRKQKEEDPMSHQPPTPDGGPGLPNPPKAG